MSETGSAEERMWEEGWEGHELAQRRRLAHLPLPDKLAWLESAHRLVLHLVRPGPHFRTDQDEPPSRLKP